MVDEVKLHVTWECPACPPSNNPEHHIGWRKPFQTNLVFSQGVRKVNSLTMVMDDASRQRIVDHLREHVNEIKSAWASMESALGALGLAMDVTVSAELEPVVTDYQICVCGHAKRRHDDACGSRGCGCQGFVLSHLEPEHDDEPEDVDPGDW